MPRGRGMRIATGAVRTGNDRGGPWGAGGGPMWASAPTKALQGVQWAGDRKGRPYGGLQGVQQNGPSGTPAPTEGVQGVRGKNPPVTASPCQPPLGKGAQGSGVRIATAGVRTGFAMTCFFARGAVHDERRGEGTPPYALHESAWKRAVGDAGPYGGDGMC